MIFMTLLQLELWTREIRLRRASFLLNAEKTFPRHTSERSLFRIFVKEIYEGNGKQENELGGSAPGDFLQKWVFWRKLKAVILLEREISAVGILWACSRMREKFVPTKKKKIIIGCLTFRSRKVPNFLCSVNFQFEIFWFCGEFYLIMNIFYRNIFLLKFRKNFLW